MVELTRRSKNEPKPTPPEVEKSVPEHGVVLEFIVDNKAGVMPDIPQERYGSCIMTMPLVQHQCITTEEDKEAIGQINAAIIADIDAAEKTPDSKNVYAHQTDFLMYKQSPAIDWVRKIAFNFVERLIATDHWTLFPVDGWGIRYEKGDRSQKHAHWPHSWAFVYYPDAPEGSAPLEIYDKPDPAIDKTLNLAREHDTSGQAIPDKLEYERHTIIPETGKLVIFPGWVQHEVKPHPIDEPRYTVAGNIAMIRHSSTQGPTTGLPEVNRFYD